MYKTLRLLQKKLPKQKQKIIFWILSFCLEAYKSMKTISGLLSLWGNHMISFSWCFGSILQTRKVNWFQVQKIKTPYDLALEHCITKRYTSSLCLNSTDLGGLEFNNQETEYKLRRGKRG